MKKAGWEPAAGPAVTGLSPGCCHISLTEEGQTRDPAPSLRERAFPAAPSSGMEPELPPCLSRFPQGWSRSSHPACPDFLRDADRAPCPAVRSSLLDGASPPHPACPHVPVDGWLQIGSCIPLRAPRFLLDGAGAAHPVPSSGFPALPAPGRCLGLRELFGSSPEFNPNPHPRGFPALELTPNLLCRIPA